MGQLDGCIDGWDVGREVGWMVGMVDGWDEGIVDG